MADIYFVGKYKALDRQKIPSQFEYTDNLVHQLIRIAEAKPYIEEYLGQPLEVQLLRQAKIMAVTYSNQIEGNKLEERGVTRILEGKETRSKDKDIVEVRNYVDAIDYVEKLSQDTRAIRTRDICDLQKLITKDLLADKKQWGTLRTIEVGIVDAISGKKIDNVPEPIFLKELMSDLWAWLDDNKSTNPFVKAYAFHFLLVAIHPFADGNGRTSRLMQHLLLLKDKENLARFVPSETSIMATRDRYYSSIRQSKILGKMNPIIEYLAECFADSSEEVIKGAKKLVKSSLERKPDVRKKRILTLARKLKEFVISDVLEAFPEIPRRTLERDLANLVKTKDLKAIGERKGRIYRVK